MAVRPLDPLRVPLSGTTLIEASAGTGKTHTITTLYLRLLLERALAVEQILVVTFTRAATAELADRIRRRISDLLAVLSGKPAADRELEALAASRPPEKRQEDQVRLLTALYSFDLAAVFTIHSFCLRMLQQHAFESGLAFDVGLSPDTSRLAEQLCDDFWVRLAQENADPQIQRLFCPKDDQRFLTAKKARSLLQQIVRLKLRHPDLQVVWGDRSADRPERSWARVCQECLDYVLRAREQHLRRSRTLGFDDLLRRFRDALRQHERLAHSVRQQFPAALIDEFQDTDPVQYDIFRTLYVQQPDCSLFLIGDPKQSIYAFRGADVFAYLRGKRDAQRQFTLTRNWRSWPALVEAVNHLLLNAQTEPPFVLEGIEFHPAKSALDGSAPEAGLELLFVPSPEGTRNKQDARPLVCNLVAREIRRFVESKPRFGEEEISYGSIAVLCNTNAQALDLQRALRRLGIPSALESEASVFDSDEARELEWVLAAVADPFDNGRVKAALATSLFGWRAPALFDPPENVMDKTHEQFFEWRDHWRRYGVMAALQAILEATQALPRLLTLADGERRVTNFFHLAELLQRAAEEQRLDPLSLVRWLGLMRRSSEARNSEIGFGEEAQLRLESDERAVKLVTIHKSKGLQYPIVYCPFLWDANTRASKELPLFHQQPDFTLQLDARLTPARESLLAARREEQAEARRRLYVALTRARLRCTVVWGNFNGAAQSALAGLLHPHAITRNQDGRPNWNRSFTLQGDSAFLRDLNQLASSSNGSIRVRRWEPPRGQTTSTTSAAVGAGSLAARPTQRVLTASWQVASFTTLIQGHDPTRPVLSEGTDYDAVGTTTLDGAPAPGQGLLFSTFPPGPVSGEILHGVLERLEFTRPVSEQRDLLEAALAGSPLGNASDLESSLQQVLDTELPTGFRLADIPRRQCLHELDFLLPVHASEGGQRFVRPADLQQTFARHCQLPNARAYAESLARLPFPAWEGFLKGYMDLVFEHEGCWYLVDYKSNQVGVRVADYASERLLPVMAQHHYLLQYHLYTVALHRFLRERLADYDYDAHFGGVLYLFLRAVSPQHPPGSGVFFDRPPRALIEALHQLFAGDKLP